MPRGCVAYTVEAMATYLLGIYIVGGAFCKRTRLT